MKKVAALFIALFVLLPGSTVAAKALEPEEITAEAAVLIDAETGQVLYNKAMEERRAPASITKILTGLLAVERLSPDELLSVSDTAVELPYNTSHIALAPGERIRMKDAMYAMMLPSANDAANVLAESMGGTQGGFAQMMNERAEEIGAVSSQFRNAHGLDEEGHYTTARDMALITAEASKNPDFMVYFGTGRYTMPATNLQSEQRPFTNQQYMLLEEMWVYAPDLLGGKVGFTDDAQHTMSSVARRGDRTLVCVVMGSGKDQKFYDTQLLFDFGFREYRSHTLERSLFEEAELPVYQEGEYVGEAFLKVQEDVTIQLHQSVRPDDIEIAVQFPEALDGREDLAVFAEIVCGSGVKDVPSLLLQIPYDIEIAPIEIVSATIPTQRQEEPRIQPALLVAALVVGAVILLVLLLCLHRHHTRKKRRERRMQRVAEMQRQMESGGQAKEL